MIIRLVDTYCGLQRTKQLQNTTQEISQSLEHQTGFVFITQITAIRPTIQTFILSITTMNDLIMAAFKHAILFDSLGPNWIESMSTIIIMKQAS